MMQLTKLESLARLLTVPVNATFYADVYTTCTGSSVTKDILVAFGIYNASNNTFTMYWGHVAQGVSIPVGQNIKVKTITCNARTPGTWDVLAALGTYNPSTGQFTVESAIVKEDLLTVTGATVTDVTLHT